MQAELYREPMSAEGSRFAIVVSRWNEELTTRLTVGALDALAACGVAEDSVPVFRVPGSFELPLACLKAAETGDYDAVIALGVVIRGETPHFDYVAGEAASGILQVGLTTGIPVMFGVITADTLQQAIDRCGERSENKGYEAALSAVEMVNLFRSMTGDGRPKGKDKVFPHVV